MYWFYLLIAGIFEVVWAIGLKLSNGFNNITISILTILGMIAGFYFLSLSLKNIPIGTAYAVWTGIGITGTVILEFFLFKEPFSLLKLICILLIISGIIGLKLLSS